MGFYETTYILHPALQEGRLNDIVNAIANKIKSLDVEILYSDNWGRKKLSYLINKEKYGTYIFLQFKINDLNKLKELNSEFEHNPNILRYLSLKIDEQDIIKSEQEEAPPTPPVKNNDINKDSEQNNKKEEE